MTGFAICKFYYFSFLILYFEQKEVALDKFLSPRIINIFFQLTKTFQILLSSTISCERYNTSQKSFGIDSTTVCRYYVSRKITWFKDSILFDKCRISVSQQKTFTNISRSLVVNSYLESIHIYVYVYIRNYNYAKAWVERDLGGGMHRLASVGPFKAARSNRPW